MQLIWRRFARRPSLPVAAACLLAGSLAAGSTAWAVIDAVLLHPIKLSNIERLAVIGRRDATSTTPQALHGASTYLFFRDVAVSGTFEQTAAAGRWTLPVVSDGVQKRLDVMFVTGDFFATLGIECQIGRCLVPGDESSNGDAVGVLTNWYWQQLGMPAPSAQSLSVSGQHVRVVGVTPPVFAGLEVGRAPAIILPIQTVRRFRNTPTNYFAETTHQSSAAGWLSIVGRVQAAHTLDQTKERLTLTPIRSIPSGSVIAVQNLNEAAVPTVARADLVRLARVVGVSSVLLIFLVCVTLSLFLLVRLEERGRELAVRRALGASKLRLAMLGVSEACLICVLGAALALPFISGALATLGNLQLPGQIDIATLSLTKSQAMTSLLLAAVVVGGLLVVVAGALAAAQLRVVPARQLSARGPVTRLRLRGVAVAVQVAVTLALSVLAALFARSIGSAVALNSELAGDQLLTTTIAVRGQTAASPGPSAFFGELARIVAGDPRIAAVAVAAGQGSLDSPGELNVSGMSITVPSLVEFVAIDDAYAKVLRLRTIEGRQFIREDANPSANTCIVSESLGRLIGTRTRLLGSSVTEPWSRAGQTRGALEIVGVLSDVVTDIRQIQPLVVYVPLAARSSSSTRRLFVRAADDLTGAFQAVSGATRLANGDVVRTPVVSFDEALTGPMAPQRLGRAVARVFGWIAACVMVLGVVVLMKAVIDRRRQEVAIRLALGAHRRSVVALVVNGVMTWVGIGLVVGIIGAAYVGYVARGLLFGVSSVDPATLATSVGAIVAVTCGLACYAGLACSRPGVMRILQRD